MIPELELHDLAKLFPPFTLAEYDELKSDIQKKGVFMPVILLDGKILDGRYRYQICCELGIEPQLQDFDPAKDPLEYVISVNVSRRGLTPAQKACIGLEYLEIEQQRAKERQAEAGRATRHANASKLVKNASQATGRAPTARKIVAVKVGTNEVYIQTAKRIHDAAPELFELVKAASMEFQTAKLLTDFKLTSPKLYPEARRQLEAHPKFKARDIINAVKGAALAKTNKTLSFPAGNKYRVLYADPPWDYGASRPGVSSPSDMYQTSHTKEIAATKLKDSHGKEWAVRDIVDKNSVLFMWTTSPHLEQSFGVIRAWGFEYKSSFIWHKIRHNMGFYNSVRHEFLLVATRGSCTPDKIAFTEAGAEKSRLFPSVYPSAHLDAAQFDMEPEQYSVDSVYEEVRGEHSKKPEYYYQLIERLYPFGKRLEMYCRSPRKGWDFWGNQAEAITEAGPDDVGDYRGSASYSAR